MFLLCPQARPRRHCLVRDKVSRLAGAFPLPTRGHWHARGDYALSIIPYGYMTIIISIILVFFTSVFLYHVWGGGEINPLSLSRHVNIIVCVCEIQNNSSKTRVSIQSVITHDDVAKSVLYYSLRPSVPPYLELCVLRLGVGVQVDICNQWLESTVLSRS